jgi:hypothetical protein
MAKRFDYMAQMSRNESKITVINSEGKAVTMSLKEFKAQNKPKTTAKERKAREAAKANSVTDVEAQIIKIEKACKYLNSLYAWYSNGYTQWGVVATTIMGLDPIRKPLGQVTAHYNGYCKVYMARIKEMSRKNDSDLFQILNWLCNHFEVVKTNLDTLMHNISESNVLSAYRHEKCINEQGRRLGLRILVQRSTTAMGDIDGCLNTLRDLVIKGVDVNEYNLKGKRIA